MQNDIVFSIDFNGYSFDGTPIENPIPNSTGIFIFVERVGKRVLETKEEPQIKLLGIYFLSEKHEIINIVELFKTKGANYLYFLNSSMEESEQTIRDIKSNNKWSNEYIVSIY